MKALPSMVRSDASVVCGISRYKSPVELWMEKTNQLQAQEAGEEVRGLPVAQFQILQQTEVVPLLRVRHVRGHREELLHHLQNPFIGQLEPGEVVDPPA